MITNIKLRALYNWSGRWGVLLKSSRASETSGSHNPRGFAFSSISPVTSKYSSLIMQLIRP